jgi:anti-sigma-K factor RskA
MDHQAIKDLLPLAALDRSEAEERRALAEHLEAGCHECESELRELREVVASYALSVDPGGSEAEIWARLEARLKLEKTRPAHSVAKRPAIPRRTVLGSFRSWPAVAALMAAGIVGLTIYADRLAARLHQTDEAYQTNLAAFESELADARAELVRAHGDTTALQQLLNQRVELQKVLTQPDLRLTRLAPMPPAPGASAVIAVSTAHNSAVLQANGLPTTPAGKTYELWWITRERGPVAAGLFRAAPGSPVIAAVAMPPAGEHVLLCAVTLEPADGVSKPTGAMYLKGAPSPA